MNFDINTKYSEINNFILLQNKIKKLSENPVGKFKGHSFTYKDFFTKTSKITMPASRSTNTQQCSEQLMKYINSMALNKQSLIYKYSRGAYSTSIDIDNLD